MDKMEKSIANTLQNGIKESFRGNKEKILSNIDNKTYEQERQVNKWKYPKLEYAIISLIAVFFVSVNLSTSVAYALYNIPVIDKVVWIAVLDKGIFDTYKSENYENVDMTSASDSVQVTLHDVIYGNKINFLFSIKFIDNLQQKNVEIEDVFFDTKTLEGKKLNLTYSSPMYNPDDEIFIFDCNIYSEVDDSVALNDSINIVIDKIALTNGEVLFGPWSFLVPLNTESFSTKYFEKEINVDVINDGTKFKIISITSAETDVFVRIETGINDSRQNQPRGVYVLDDEGIRRDMIDAIGYKQGDKMIYDYYFDSVYPNYPQIIGFNLVSGEVFEFDVDTEELKTP